MSSLVLVARHGETDWNAGGRWQGNTDIPINRNGRIQAGVLAESMSLEGITSIYSSDLSRAQNTAEIVAGRLGINEIRLDGRLRERSLGLLEGKTTEEVLEMTGMKAEDLNILTMRGDDSIESLESFTGRLSDVFGHIGVHGDGEKTLVVAHGGVMMALSVILLGKEFPRKFTNGEILRMKYDGSWSIPTGFHGSTE